MVKGMLQSRLPTSLAHFLELPTFSEIFHSLCQNTLNSSSNAVTMRIASVDFLSLTEVVGSLGKGLKIKLPPHDELVLGIPCLVWLPHLKKNIMKLGTVQ